MLGEPACCTNAIQPGINTHSDAKQRERKDRIATLPEDYQRYPTTFDGHLYAIPSTDNSPLTSPSSPHPSYSESVKYGEDDYTILNAGTRTLVANVQSGKWKASSVLRAYTRAALEAHARTNCITEVLVDEARRGAEAWDNLDFKAIPGPEQPLFGMPVSLKDTVSVAGYDACIGYSAWVGNPIHADSALVHLLRKAGATLYVKTAIPTTLLSFEARSAVFGQCTNPHNPLFSPGGSSGGEAALLALGGSRIGIGTDVAGSVRVPAHYSGVYAVRASAGRFLKSGNRTSMPGQEGVPAVCSPMARTLDDLETFWEAVMHMKPWTYDHSVSKVFLSCFFFLLFVLNAL